MSQKKDTTTKKYLSAQDIKKAEDTQIVDVEVPEWGGCIRLKGLSGEEATQFVEMIAQSKKSDSLVNVLVMCAIDEDGNRLFTKEDVETLKKKSMKALLRVQEVALQINGLEKEEQAALKKD